MLIIIEMTLEETILEKHKITEVKILEADTEQTLEMIILEEVEVGLGIDNIQVILAEMTEIVVVGLDQVQEPITIETDLDALHGRNIIISLRTVQLHKYKKNQSKYNKCIIWIKSNSIKSFGNRYLWQSQ